MINCPSCNNAEYEGTLFCGECGARLWPGPTADEAANLTPWMSRPSNATTLGMEVKPAVATSPSEISIHIHGAAAPVRLTGKAEYLLGRSDPRSQTPPDLDLAPYGGQEMGVSREHARVRYDESGLSIRDLGSTNGTQVNGRPLAADETCRLQDGDEIQLGKLAFNIYFAAADNAPR